MIDRGPESRQVLEHLMRPIPGLRRIALMGNHEAMLLDFLADPSPASIWLRNGGVETLQSFGLDPATLVALPYPERAPMLHRTLGDATLQFLQSLPAYASFPGTVLVHAGIRPGVSITQQREADLLWIRDLFLKAERDYGLFVVHGHTASGMPQFGHSRIGIDAGAYETGILTCACLEPGKLLRLLPVGPLMMWLSTA